MIERMWQSILEWIIAGNLQTLVNVIALSVVLAMFMLGVTWLWGKLFDRDSN